MRILIEESCEACMRENPEIVELKNKHQIKGSNSFQVKDIVRKFQESSTQREGQRKAYLLHFWK